MATLYKNISNQPQAGELALLYLVGPDKQAIISSITICNQGKKNATFRLAIKPAGDSIASYHYRFYDTKVLGNRSYIATVGIALKEEDTLLVYSSNSLLSFSADIAEMDL